MCLNERLTRGNACLFSRKDLAVRKDKRKAHIRSKKAGRKKEDRST